MSVSHDADAGGNNRELVYSELQLQQFSLVEDQLKTLGIGLSKEIATKNGTQLCDNIKSVEMKEVGLSEAIYGRKIYTHIRTIFTRYNLGSNLSDVVETNFPIDRFINRLQEEINGLSDKKKELEIPKVYPPKSMEMYMIYAEREFEKILEAERGDADRPKRAKSRKKAVSGVEGETPAESELTGDEGDPEDERFKALKKKYRFQYADDDCAYDDYLRACEKVKHAESEVSELETRTGIIRIMVDNLRNAGNILVQKIQNAVASSDKIKQKLSSLVTLERTGETIANPFDSNNLAGMCFILKTEYYTATLIQFNNDFSDTLRCSIPAVEVLINPMKAVQLTDKRIAEWTTMNYWKYMTMDIFFVNILLGYIPGGSPLKDKCVVAVEEFIEKRESVNDWSEQYSQVSLGGTGAMPIYRFLAEFIRRIENSSKHRSIIGVGATGGNAPTGNKTPSKDTYQGNKRYTGNVEAAAAAGTQYTTVVAREQGVVIKDVETGREYPYTATKDECSVCYGKAEQGAHFSKLSAKCYRGVCRACGLFGHKSGNCQQHANTYVNSKPSGK